MKILAIAPAHESQRFVRGYPPKGAWLLRQPPADIRRLASLVDPCDRFRYQDDRCQLPHAAGDEDLCLIHVDQTNGRRAQSIASDLSEAGLTWMLFGPGVAAWQERVPGWAVNRVVGDIVAVWARLRVDALAGRLEAVYAAPPLPTYVPAATGLGPRVDLNNQQQQTSFIVGCRCPEHLRPFCASWLYYRESRLARSIDEIVGEVVSLPRKHIELLDEDIAAEPEHYHELFRLLWNYHRHWTVRAGLGLFDHPDLIRLLAKAGVRIVWLSDDFIGDRLAEAVADKRLARHLHRQVKSLQSRRMLVGAQITIRLDRWDRPDFHSAARLLRQIDLDLVELRFISTGPDGSLRLEPVDYRSMRSTADPAWLKSRFYDLGSIINRVSRRPRRVGFYTTGVFLLPYCLAYRQNLLEGIPGP